MTTEYDLVRNKLTGAKDRYRARVRPCGTVGLEEVIKRMADRGTTVGKADILAVFEVLCSVVEEFLLEGVNVVTPLANFRLSIKGGFNRHDERFHPKRHHIVPSATPGRRLRRTIRLRARAARRAQNVPAPNPLSYTDVNSGLVDSVLTPGGMGRLYGSRLQFDPGDPAQGVFFVPRSERIVGRSGTRVQIVGDNLPSTLLFLVPALPPGGYRLEVRATVPGSEEVRGGALPRRLTVREGYQNDRGAKAAPENRAGFGVPKAGCSYFLNEWPADLPAESSLLFLQK